MLCNTIVLGSATILALLLTLLGVSSGTESKLKDRHYNQVLVLARFDTALFIAAILVFQLTNIPLTEAENLPSTWYSSIYWSTLFASSLLTGGIVSVIFMLYNAVSNIIKIVGLDDADHHLVMEQGQQDEKN